MRVITNSSTRLVVEHREPMVRVVGLLICAGVFTLVPVGLTVVPSEIGAMPMLVNAAFIAVFIGAAVLAFHVRGCTEVYTIDTARAVVELRRTTRRRTRTQWIPFAQVQEIFHESTDTDEGIKDYVVLTLELNSKRVRLPMRIYTFSSKERIEFARLIGVLLGRRLRFVHISGSGKTAVSS